MQTKQRIHRDERTGGRRLVELLQLMEAGLAVTAVTLTVAMAPAAIISGEPLPDITPIVDSMVNKEVQTETEQ